MGPFYFLRRLHHQHTRSRSKSHNASSFHRLRCEGAAPDRFFVTDMPKQYVDRVVQKALFYRPSHHVRKFPRSTPSSSRKSRTTPFFRTAPHCPRRDGPLLIIAPPSRRVGNGPLSATPHETPAVSINPESLSAREAVTKKGPSHRINGVQRAKRGGFLISGGGWGRTREFADMIGWLVEEGLLNGPVYTFFYAGDEKTVWGGAHAPKVVGRGGVVQFGAASRAFVNAPPCHRKKGHPVLSKAPIDQSCFVCFPKYTTEQVHGKILLLYSQWHHDLR